MAPGRPDLTDGRSVRRRAPTVRLRVGPSRWVDRIVLLIAWLAVDACLRIGVSLPFLAHRCSVTLAIDGGGVPLPAGATGCRLTVAERRRLSMIDAIAARWSFGAGPCLRRALVAGWVLRHHNPRLRLGANTDSHRSGALAHAWVELPDGRTVGYQPGFIPFTGHSA